MADFSQWFNVQKNTVNASGVIVVTVSKLIALKPSTATIVSPASRVSIGAQTVRIDQMSSGAGENAQQRGENLVVSVDDVVITGYKNHASISDTDLQRGDRFIADDITYELVNVFETVIDRFLATGRIQR